MTSHRLLARASRRALVALLGLAACAAIPAAPLGAQGTWDAVLAVDPNPSPYLADWESNQSLGTLTVTNGTTNAQSVRLVFSVVNGQGRVLVSGSSEAQLIPADAPAIFHSPVSIAGRTRHDAEMESQMKRTGRLPEGSYRLCIMVVDLGGFELAEACEGFTLVYPEPPLLVSPANQEVVENSDLFFQWTPSHVPVGIAVRYVLQVAELRPGQLASEALRSSALHFADANVTGAHLQYPMDAPRMKPGHQYAWRVQALDANGYPVASNAGSSEIWTFRYSDGTEANPAGPGGDPTRYKLVLAADEPAEDGGVALTPSIGQICAPVDQGQRDDTDETLTLRYHGPAFSFDELYVSVEYAVDTLAFGVLSHRWVAHGRSATSKLEVLAAGDCDAAFTPSGITRLHYIALKTRERSFDEFLRAAFDEPGSSNPWESYTPQQGIGLDFATAVVSLRVREVGKDESHFQSEKDFFEGHSFDVKPGMNVYGVIRLDETGDGWAALRALGMERELIISGFAGMSSSVSLGIGHNTDGGAISPTITREKFRLRVLLPERRGPISAIKTIRAGIEFVVNDSSAVIRGDDGALTTITASHIIGRLVGVVLTEHQEIEFTGGLDRSVEQVGAGAVGKPKVEFVLSASCDCTIPFLPAIDGKIGEFVVEFHYDVTNKDEMILILSGEAQIGKVPPVLIGTSWTWKKKVPSATSGVPDVVTAEAQALEAARSDLARMMTDRALLQAQISKGTPAAASGSLAPPPSQPVFVQWQGKRVDAQEQMRVLDGRVKAAQEDVRKAEENLAAAQPAAAGAAAKAADPKAVWGLDKWRIRAAAGNVPLTDIMDLFRAAIR